MKNLIGNKIGNVVNLMIDGNAFQKTFTTQDEANDFFKLMHTARSGDKTALDAILFELNRKYKTVIKGVLEKDSDDNYYLKGIDIKMPQLLADTFLDYLENDFPVNALSNFWKLLVSNPDIRVREDLFKFLQTYNFAITDNGYFIAYKAVEVKDAASDFDLASFVTNQYLKIKKWKKNPANFVVAKLVIVTTEEVEVENPDYEYFGDIDDEEDENYGEEDNGQDEYITEENSVRKFELRLVELGKDYNKHFNELAKGMDAETSYEILGNLSELFKGIDQVLDNQRTVYQSMHSGKTGKVEQVLGVPVKMDRPDTNTDHTVECSSGLHVGSVKYVEGFGNSNSDRKILLVLVNPAHVVAVPRYDNSKMRTCEYFPYAELERLPDGKFEVVESSYFEDDYLKYEASELEAEIERIQTEIEKVEVGEPNKEILNYKKILEDRLITIEEALAK